MSKILCVDDDITILQLLIVILSRAGFEVTIVSNPKEAVAHAVSIKPDMILLDVMMPELSGYEVCAALRNNPETADVPVIFVTALNQDSDKVKALSLGAVDFVSKPFKKDLLIPLLNRHLAQEREWAKSPTGDPAAAPDADPAADAAADPEKSTAAGPASPTVVAPQTGSAGSLIAFRQFLLAPDGPGAENPEAVKLMSPLNVYKVLEQFKFSPSESAKTIASFLNLPFMPIINPDNIKLGVLPVKFAQGNNLVVVQEEGKEMFVVIPNPFNFEMIESIGRMVHDKYSFAVSDPASIANLYSFAQDLGGVSGGKSEGLSMEAEDVSDTAERKALGARVEESSVKYITGKIIESAIQERASDIHIEPKELSTILRFRIDGDLREFTKLNKITAVKVLTRLKVLGGLDITERRRPQDGAFVAQLGLRKFTLRLATTATNYGESMVVRLIEPYAKPKTLAELGMDEKQCELMKQLSQKNQSMIILAGPTGSGKTTTVYSFLSSMDSQRRSLISVEDPIEFRIPNANQQQVNEKAGATFEALLRSSVRQDPDILFMGEIRDKISAQTALDFASTGHLTISTIHTSNATTAVFRLERLGVTRAQIAYTMLAVVSQRLIKRLCHKCRELRPVDEEITRVFTLLNYPVPATTGHPIGCLACNNTGYNGREAVYEILLMTPEVSEMIRLGDSIHNIREALRRKNVTLITDAALGKVTQGITSFIDAYNKVLAEDIATEPAEPEDRVNVPPASAPAASPDFATAVPAAPVVPVVSAAPVNTVTALSPFASVDLPPAIADDNLSDEAPVYIGVQSQAQKALQMQVPKKILVVDDDPDILLLAKKVIAKAGYEVTAVKDGIEAIMRLSVEKFDLVLSDIDMPNLDGMRLLDILRQKNIHVDVVFLTAQEESDEIEEKCLTLGALDYIRKPVKKEILLLRLRNIFARKR